MIADTSRIERGRGDAGHPAPPSLHARFADDVGVESLRGLAADTRRALDAAHVRLESITAREWDTRNWLAEAQEALHARDAEYSETIRSLLDRLSELESVRSERDSAHRLALAAESRCRALEQRFEHVLMKIPRRFARKLRARLVRRANSSDVERGGSDDTRAGSGVNLTSQ